jgi:predicted acetyltransferase
MSPAESPPALEVSPAAPEEAPVLANLLELYAHDFSAIADLHLGRDGRYGYSRLAQYWTDPTRFPFLVRVDGRPAGFALIAKGSEISGDPEVWDVSEFFVVRRHRRRGVGAAVAHEIWRRFPGRWEVRVMENNPAAIAFWAAAVRDFIGAEIESVLVDTGERRWQVFAFDSAVS